MRHTLALQFSPKFQLQHTEMQRAFVLIFTCCFMIAGLTHGRDIWRGGLFPYHAVAMPINAFWTALCPLDLMVAALAW